MSEISESYRYIVRSPDVRGGNARVEGTRIAVHDVIGLLQNGETVDSLTGSCLPTLTRAQVYECLAYYEDHRGEIDLLVARPDGARATVRFLLDHDVPEDLIYLLQELGHHVVRLRDVLAGGLRFDNPAIRS
jgi:uncharacterized protein (DUF433 family)